LKDASYPTVTIVGTPWYNILSNPMYVNEFSFVASYVNERHKIINDGYPDVPEIPHEVMESANAEEKEKWEANNKILAKYKGEQSDLVMILLQLAYIPDEVLQDVDFTTPGWSYRFWIRMEKYKADFNEKWEEKSGKWTFQNEMTEGRYVEFMKEEDAKEDGFSGRALPSYELDQIKKKQEEYKMTHSGLHGAADATEREGALEKSNTMA